MDKFTVEDASHLLGLPWKRASEGPDSYDCWGLVKYCLDKMGVDYSVSVDYTFPYGIEKEFEDSISSWKEIQNPYFNCIVYGYVGNHPSHIGFVIGPYVLHSIGDVGHPGYVAITKISSFKKIYNKTRFFTWRK